MKRLMNVITLVSAVILFTTGCTMEQKDKALNRANMDLTINPADDFDEYANGGWKKQNPVPDDKGSFGTFTQLRDDTKEQLKVLFDELLSEEFEQGSVGQKLSDFYKSGMDTNRINEQGISPLQPYFDKIDAIQNTDDLQKVVAELHTRNMYPFFGMFTYADMKNSDTVVAYFWQGGLGMPDRDYYLKDDERSVEIQGKYLDHLAKMLTFTGFSENEAKDNAIKIMEFETRLAKASMTRLETRDPDNYYNSFNTEKLTEIAPITIGAGILP